MLVGEAGDAEVFDVIVIGAGQAGLAAGYFLRRSKLRYVILDRNESPGGSWRHTWDSLRLFSPARWSSLPGRLMEGGPDYYPHRDEVIDYLEQYETAYKLPVRRGVKVLGVFVQDERLLRVETSVGTFFTRYVISAAGSWGNPSIPSIPGREDFNGMQIHSAQYRTPLDFAGKRVAVVGGGNSGAQILAELAGVAHCSWITEREPIFLPPELDGRAIFDLASAKYRGEGAVSPASLGDIVQVAPVRQARERGVYDHYLSPPEQITADGMRWNDGQFVPLDAIIWCTGFKADLEHLRPLGLQNTAGRVAVRDNQSLEEPRVFLLGYGSWTGYASATLVGIGRTARTTVKRIQELADAAAENAGESD